MRQAKRRLDTELISRGLFDGPEQAKAAIEARRVLIDGAPARTPATLVTARNKLSVLENKRYVSRGGEKLEGALRDLEVDPAGLRCLDAGAGPGGFTDCLLQQGAAHVLAVDVGYGQFDWRLRNDARVKLLERTNVRSLTPENTQGPFDLVVADLSFIGLRQVAPALSALASDEGSLLLMVKPQHEADRTEVGEGGVVRDPAVWAKALDRVAQRLAGLDFGVVGAVPSRLKGAQGNQEFFLLARRGEKPRPSAWRTAASAAAAAKDSGDPEDEI